MSKPSSLNEYGEGMFWTSVAGNSTLIGVTQETINSVGDVEEIELAEVGDEFEEGDWIGEIRGRETAIEILAPYPLEIEEANETVVSDVGMLADDPTGDAWLLRVKKRDE